MSYSKFPPSLGEFEVVTVANPAAGAIFTYTPESNMIVRPLFVRCLLTADATAANRYFRIEYEVVTGTIALTAPAYVVQVATEAIRYNASLGAYDPAPISTNHSVPLPSVFLDSSGSLHGRCTGLQAADQFSDIYIGILKWRQ